MASGYPRRKFSPRTRMALSDLVYRTMLDDAIADSLDQRTGTSVWESRSSSTRIDASAHRDEARTLIGWALTDSGYERNAMPPVPDSGHERS